MAEIGVDCTIPVAHKPTTTPCRELYLPLETWQIRLLRLHPGSPPEPLLGDLVTAALLHANAGVIVQGEFSKRQYNALSYTWGITKSVFPIQLNGHEISVTSTLGEALMHIRDARSGVYLWVDALCINQADNEEKAYQVQKMFDIFSTAHTVIVWLGVEDRGSKNAIDFVKACVVADINGSRSSTVAPWSKVRRVVQGGRYHDRLLELCTRPWNRRAWVQQEIFAAARVLVRYGKSELTLANLQSAATLLIGMHTLGRFQLSSEQQMSLEALTSIFQAPPSLKEKIAYLRSSGRTGECYCNDNTNRAVARNTSPQCVLWRSRHITASDPRDYVYAILGLTDCVTRPGPSSHIENKNDVLGIDYARPTSLVFQDFTKYLMNGDDGSLAVLCGHRPRPLGGELDLPSWCPDWRQPHHCLLAHPHVAYSQTQHYSQHGILVFTGLIVAVRAARSGNRNVKLTVDIDEDGYTIGTAVNTIDVSKTPAAWHIPPNIPWQDEYVQEGLAEYYHAEDECLKNFQIGDIAALPIRSRLEDVHYWIEMPVLRPRNGVGYTFVGMLGLSLESHPDQSVTALLDLPREEFVVH